MDRLAKKCVIASAIVHGTLVVVLIVGPAFLGSDDQKFTPDKFIDFVPYKTIEESLSGGGRPDVPNVVPLPEPPKPPVVRTATPPPPKVVEKVEQPKDDDKAVKDVVKEQKTDKESLEVAKRKPNKIVLVRANDKTAAKSKEAAKAEAKATQEAEDKRRQEIARNIDSATSTIRTSASGSVKIDEPRGPGGGGIPYAGFNQALASIYMRNWIAPSDAADSDAKVIVAVTLNRNGSVVSSRITKSSGNADLDRSVQQALDKVSFVAPFPEAVKDLQKTFHLEFDPKTKRMMG